MAAESECPLLLEEVENHRRRLITDVHQEVVRRWRLGREFRDPARVLSDLSLDAADRRDVDRLPRVNSAGASGTADEASTDWATFMLSRESVCILVGPAWPSPKLRARHLGATWVVLWPAARLPLELRPVLVPGGPLIEGVEWASPCNKSSRWSPPRCWCN